MMTLILIKDFCYFYYTSFPSLICHLYHFLCPYHHDYKLRYFTGCEDDLLVAYLPLKHKDMGSIPKFHAGKLDKVAPSCNLSAGELGQTDPWNFQAGHLRPLHKFQVSGTSFNLTQWIVPEEWFGGCLTHDSYPNTCAHI